MSTTGRKGEKWKPLAWTTGCSKLDDWLLCQQGHSQAVTATRALSAWHVERTRLSFFFKDTKLLKWPQAASTPLQHPDLTNAFQRLQPNGLGCVAFSHSPLLTPLTRLPSLHHGVLHRSGHSGTAQHQKVREPTRLSKPRRRKRKEEPPHQKSSQP